MSGSFRETIRDTLFTQLFGTLQNPDGSYPWRVLVLDAVTVKVLSSALRMSELQNKGISLVENLELPREPLQLEAVYFISPTDASIATLAADQDKGLYTGVHVFFSATVESNALSKIKKHKNLVNKLKTLREANLEVSVLDAQCFLTDQPDALYNLYEEKANPHSSRFQAELESIASRLLTVFQTLKERPSIRYSKPSKFPSSMGHRTSICEELARRLDHRIEKMNTTDFPKVPSCDCLILDRTMDAVAPIIHEWTYEAMVYDLLSVESGVYKRPGGGVGTSEVVLDEQDHLWKELRHMHIAEASTVVNDKIDAFKKANAAARIKGAAGNAMTTQDMRTLIQSLPEYRDVLSNMALHVDITRDLFQITNDRHLKEIGELEQDLVYGEKHSKDIIGLLSNDLNLDAEDKMRLFMCYLATHPDKLDTERRLQWQRLARLTANQMDTMLNLEYLGISVTKKDSTSLLGFVRKNKSKGIRKPKASDAYTQQYALEKFQPELVDILEKLCGGELPREEYPFVRGGPSSSASSNTPSGSVRTNYGWSKKKKESSETKSRGKRLVVFVVGGVSRSEMRVIHKSAATLQRDIVLGSTAVETPTTFIQKLSSLSATTDEESVKLAIT